MAYRAEINVMPLKELLDPKGKAVASSMQNLELHEIKDVRIGKHIQLIINTNSESEAQKLAMEACKKLLANPIMESYTIEVFKV